MPRLNAVSFHEDHSIESICRKIKAAGFDAVEVSRPPFYYRLVSAGTRKRFAEWASELGLFCYGFDCWVEVEPYAAFDETVADFQRAIDWAVDLDLGMVISHDPWAKVNGDRSPEACLKATIDLFQRVADRCHEGGLGLTFEPHPDTLSMENSWAIDFIDALAEGRPEGSIGILYDLCHYGVGQKDDAVDSIGVLGKRIRHLHFSDGDQETYALHLPLGDGCIDLEGSIAALKAIGFDGTLTNDLFNYPLLEDGARRNAGPIAEVEQKLGLKEP
ncbi:MAG: sugar phosphate isomerase/epimerase family protein [Candidatus Latescibacterota bacterium]